MMCAMPCGSIDIATLESARKVPSTTTPLVGFRIPDNTFHVRDTNERIGDQRPAHHPDHPSPGRAGSGEVGDNQAVSAPNGLRNPALSDTLLHFTSRARQRPDLPGTIAINGAGAGGWRISSAPSASRVSRHTGRISRRCAYRKAGMKTSLNLLGERGWQPWGCLGNYPEHWSPGLPHLRGCWGSPLRAVARKDPPPWQAWLSGPGPIGPSTR